MMPLRSDLMASLTTGALPSSTTANSHAETNRFSLGLTSSWLPAIATAFACGTGYVCCLLAVLPASDASLTPMITSSAAMATEKFEATVMMSKVSP